MRRTEIDGRRAGTVLKGVIGAAGLAWACLCAQAGPARAWNESERAHGEHRWWEEGGCAACMGSRLEGFDAAWEQPGDRGGRGEGGARGAGGERQRADVDEATGRSLLNYPKHRVVDWLHMRLDVTIPDMEVATAGVVQTLRFAPIGREARSITLDAGPAGVMDIESIELDGAACEFTHEGERLRVRLARTVDAGEEGVLVTRYRLTDPPEGLMWTPSIEGWKGIGGVGGVRAAQVHTQGQSDSNHFWFPCHDFPNERLTTEIVADVPAGYMVSANGRLVGRRDVGGAGGGEGVGGRSVWHWSQDRAHVNYLVSMVVGKFDVEDVGGAASARPGLVMDVWGPPGSGADGSIRRTYGLTAEMVALFERLFGEEYPWARYAQVVAWNFGAGGMENTSATTLYDTCVLDEAAAAESSLEGLIAHELAHQWFGDLITCNSWEHIWLNEGWATYSSALWWEHSKGRADYEQSVLGSMSGVIRADRGSLPGTPGMVSKEYGSPDETFRRASNPYPKGASILHMARAKIGDEAFFAGVRAYVDKKKDGTAETDEFRRCLEESSGQGLERFFEQWCMRPGVPRVKVGVAWDAASGSVSVRAEQTQTIDGHNPAYAIEIPVWVRESSGWRRGVVAMDSRAAETTITGLSQTPGAVVIDPELTVLAEYTVEFTGLDAGAMWASQVREGPTHASRVLGARRIGQMEKGAVSAEAAAALAETARDTSAHGGLRREAIQALARLGRAAELMPLMDFADADASIRRELVSAAISLARDGDEAARRACADVLVERLENDPSYGVRAEAVGGLGTLKATWAISSVIAACGIESQHDQVRQDALGALADLDAPEGLDVAIAYTGVERYNRTRPAAIRAVGRLAKHNPAKAKECLLSALKARERRAVSAAAGALIDLGDGGTLAEMEELTTRARSESERRSAQRWVDELKGKLAESEKEVETTK